MASGINSTFRQVGIATGIALLGTLFTNRLTSPCRRSQLAPRSPRTAPTSPPPCATGSLFATIPTQQRSLLVGVVRGSFTTALNEILLVAAIISFVAGILSFALIRSKDFVSPSEP